MGAFRFARRILGVGAASALLSACGGSSSELAAQTNLSNAVRPATGNKTFYYTGSKQSFVSTRGSQVDHGRRSRCRRKPKKYLAGRGGRVYARYSPFIPARRYTPSLAGRALIYGRGGFNGGGPGGVYPHCQRSGSYCLGSAGGGASDVRQGGTSLSDCIIVAGGGGGEGGTKISMVQSPPVSVVRAAEKSAATVLARMAVATAAEAAALRRRAAPAVPEAVLVGTTEAREATARWGRVVAAAAQATIPAAPGYTEGGAGGGGGGGYYGGGGGAGGGAGYASVYGVPGSGGGGGSSYVYAKATKYQMWRGWHKATGNGLAVFSWQ